jgi:predicted cupin superfamily sugar epimerase
MAASCSGEHGYSLVGCTLSPGFEYKDFELADPNHLLEAYPEHEDIIERFGLKKNSL